MLGRRPRSLVGLDIGSSAVKAVELREGGGRYCVEALAVEPLPSGSIVDGAIVDKGVVSDTVRKVFESQAIKTKEVAISLAGTAVIVKKLSLPTMRPEELSASIYWEARQYIPFAIEDVHLDYQVLDLTSETAAKGIQDVLLVAARKERVADYADVVARAGCVPVVVDVDAFALQNAYEMNHGIEPETVVALLNVRGSAININVIHGGQPIFTRDLAIGGNAYTEALQKELSLGFDDADRLKRGVWCGHMRGRRPRDSGSQRHSRY